MSDVININIFQIDDRDFKSVGRPFNVSISLAAEIKDVFPKILQACPSLESTRYLRLLKIRRPIPLSLPSATEEMEGLDNATPRTRSQGPKLEDVLLSLREANKDGLQLEPTTVYVYEPSIADDVKRHFSLEDGRKLQALLVHPFAFGARNQVQDPDPDFRRLNLQALTGGSPLSKTVGKHARDLRSIALINAPAGRYTFPVALYDSNLAMLQYKLSKLDLPNGCAEAALLFPEEESFYEDADSFIDVAISRYEFEDDRKEASMPFLRKCFGIDIDDEYEYFKTDYKIACMGRIVTLDNASAQSSIKFDCAALSSIGVDVDPITKRNIKISRAIVEIKNTEGSGDVHTQLGKDVAEEANLFKDRPYFYSTHFPKILMGLTGQLVEISAAVCLETVVVNRLLILDVQDSLFREIWVRKLARMASALSECSKALDAHYAGLAARGECKRWFPSPTLIPTTDTTIVSKLAFASSPTFFGVKINYCMNHETGSVCNLETEVMPTPAQMRHNLLLGNLLDAAQTEVIIKVVDRYCKQAHECLAEAKLAPKLHLCERVIGDMLSDMFVVVMDRVKGATLGKHEWRSKEEKQEARDGLASAREILRANGLVHGDLRAPNILIGLDGKLKVIDFDWAAKDDEGTYPWGINVGELGDEWHRDVGAMKRMKMEHDAHAIDSVLVPTHF